MEIPSSENGDVLDGNTFLRDRDRAATDNVAGKGDSAFSFLSVDLNAHQTRRDRAAFAVSDATCAAH
jgi:hypothetical protein